MGKPIVTYFSGPGWLDYPVDNAYTYSPQVAQGNWNMVWTHTQGQLDAAQANGLRAMWFGSYDAATGELGEDVIRSVRDTPSLYCYYFQDEPKASDFPKLAAAVARLRELDPNRMAYINLLPSAASSSQLGASNYRAYLSQYIEIVKPDFLSYDHYQFYTNSDTAGYFLNLAVISHTAKGAGIPFMNIVQACSYNSNMRIPNGNELRFLYTTSLAYGAQGISDFVYYSPDFTGGMVTSDGTPTTLYTTAQTINREFVAVAIQVQALTHIGAYHLGDLPPGYGTTDGSSPLRLPDNSPFKISGIADSSYQSGQPVRGAVIGLFGPDNQLNDATYAYVVNLNYSDVLNTQVTGPGNLSVFDPTTGKWIAQGHAWADLTLEKGGGVLVGLTSMVPEPSAIVLLSMGLTGLFAYGWRKRK
jgi:hypothetical protein